MREGVVYSHTKKQRTETSVLCFSKYRCWHRVIFPGGGPPSIFTEVSLYDRVRDGNGWFTYSWTPANSFALRWKLHNDYKLYASSTYLFSVLLIYRNFSWIIASRFALIRSVLLLQNFRSFAPRFFELGSLCSPSLYAKSARKSPRPISISRLKMLPLLYL